MLHLAWLSLLRIFWWERWGLYFGLQDPPYPYLAVGVLLLFRVWLTSLGWLWGVFHFHGCLFVQDKVNLLQELSELLTKHSNFGKCPRCLLLEAMPCGGQFFILMRHWPLYVLLTDSWLGPSHSLSFLNSFFVHLCRGTFLLFSKSPKALTIDLHLVGWWPTCFFSLTCIPLLWLLSRKFCRLLWNAILRCVAFVYAVELF